MRIAASGQSVRGPSIGESDAWKALLEPCCQVVALRNAVNYEDLPGTYSREDRCRWVLTVQFLADPADLVLEDPTLQVGG